MEKKIKGILKRISKIISWSVIVMLIIIILFLATVVVTTKVNEKMNKAPMFSLYTIISPSMVPNINVYDVVFVSKVDAKKLKKGDVISFYVKGSTLGKTPVTHRITRIKTTGTGEYTFSTKGDAVAEEDKWRYPVTESDVVGKVIFKLPQLGRLQFFLSSKMGWFLVVLLPALGIISYDLYKLVKLIIIKSRIIEERELDTEEETNSNVIQENKTENLLNENIIENKNELSDNNIIIPNNTKTEEFEINNSYINEPIKIDNNLCDNDTEQEIITEIIDLDKKLSNKNDSD